jgi:valyl-tRNA synthetase
LISALEENIEVISLGNCSNALTKFFINDFCDIYLEISKPVLKGNSNSCKLGKIVVMNHIFETYLKAAHPFLPHLTEVSCNCSEA